MTMLTSQNCQRNKLNIYDELNNYILQWSKEDIAEIYQAVKVYDKLLGRKNNREDFITFIYNVPAHKLLVSFYGSKQEYDVPFNQQGEFKYDIFASMFVKVRRKVAVQELSDYKHGLKFLKKIFTNVISRFNNDKAKPFSLKPTEDELSVIADDYTQFQLDVASHFDYNYYLGYKLVPSYSELIFGKYVSYDNPRGLFEYTLINELNPFLILVTYDNEETNDRLFSYIHQTYQSKRYPQFNQHLKEYFDDSFDTILKYSSNQFLIYNLASFNCLCDDKQMLKLIKYLWNHLTTDDERQMVVRYITFDECPDIIDDELKLTKPYCTDVKTWVSKQIHNQTVIKSEELLDYQAVSDLMLGHFNNFLQLNKAASLQEINDWLLLISQARYIKSQDELKNIKDLLHQIKTVISRFSELKQLNEMINRVDAIVDRCKILNSENIFVC